MCLNKHSYKIRTDLNLFSKDPKMTNFCLQSAQVRSDGLPLVWSRKCHISFSVFPQRM